MKRRLIIFATLIGFFFSFANNVSHISNSLYQKESTAVNVLANAHLGDVNTDDLFNELVSSVNDETYINDTYASYYFSNLRENFGNNVFGSCGYISVGMLLSFYDAYWDDDFIANSYDVKSTYTSTMQPLADFYLVPSNADSPGIKFEPSSLINNVNIEEYLNLADQNKGTINSLDTMQPGQASGETIFENDLLNTNKVVAAIKSDADILEFEFDEIDANESCPDGAYKAAFVIDNQYSNGDRYRYDYHWYRENSDGSWSHKPGTTPVKNTDISDKLIMDPRTCNRNSGNGLNYNLFVGFYVIRPLNKMYVNYGGNPV